VCHAPTCSCVSSSVLPVFASAAITGTPTLYRYCRCFIVSSCRTLGSCMIYAAALNTLLLAAFTLTNAVRATYPTHISQLYVLPLP
jgi:hypothetical protein